MSEMTLKQEIEVGAIAAIRCPSCGAMPGQLCYSTKAVGGLGRLQKKPTHQRRLSTFVAQNIKVKS